jgi:hypothetical protein
LIDYFETSYSKGVADRIGLDIGPIATELYSSMPIEFQAKLLHWNVNAPLAAVREGVDSSDLIEGAEFRGGRPAYLHEIAGVVVMLCNPEGAWRTGSVICANGGLKFSY